MKRLETLENSGILPVLVFDGKCPAMKVDVEAKRRQRRKNNRVEALKCMDEGDNPKAMEKMKQSITAEFSMALALMNRCREKSFNHVVSPYESDVQLTYLQKIGVI